MVFQESVYFRGCYRITDNALQTMTADYDRQLRDHSKGHQGT